MLIKEICLYCQKPFTRSLSPDNLKRGKGKYCKTQCCVSHFYILRKEGKIRLNLKGLKLGELKGKKHTIKTREKIAQSLRGKMGILARNFGNHHSLPTKRLLSQKQKLNWKNKGYREKMIKASLRSLFKRPTSLEKQMIDIIKKYNLSYRYVGDGSFLIGYKNPDFININGEKKLIEVGNVFHHQGDYVEKRRKHFAKYGWESYIFIGDKLDENTIIKRLERNKI